MELVTERISVIRWQESTIETAEDQVAIEAPIALCYNGISHAVMMATPADLEDFAVGFSLTEGVIEKPEDIYDQQVQFLPQGIEIQMDISSRCQMLLKQQRRSFTGRTGCGLCGVESLQHASRPITPLEAYEPITDTAIQKALQQLPQWQPLRQATGACHGAVWCQADGNILLAREDVGRHNALDKLIGALYRQKINRDKGFVLISSRASFEMVQKVAEAKIGNLVAVSAPTSLALKTAAEAGVNLVGFGRPGRHIKYTSNSNNPTV